MKKLRYKSRLFAATLSIGCSMMAFGFQARIGDPAPQFSVTSMSGKQMFLPDMQTGGPIFIYFIRDGNAVTQQATSYIDKIIRAYGTSRTTWYGFLNAREDRARSYQAETNPAFRLERDENLTATKAFGIGGSPTVLEYDGNGKLMNVWKGFSAVKLKAMNIAVAAASHKPILALDFSAAPSTALYGIDFNNATSSQGTGSGSGC